MITFPNAKINLGLNIVERRADGYHNIETVFYPVPLTDVLEIVPAAVTSLSCYGNEVDCPAEKNLVMKAYRLLQQRFDLPPVEMHLYKHIPDGAGLGGGSSDAAHALIMLNRMFNLQQTDSALAAMAATLGADCAFFIYNRPMLGTGRGEILEPFDIDLSGYRLDVIVPEGISVSTADAYRGIVPKVPDLPLREVLAHPVTEWKGLLVNDFETTVFEKHPRLAEIKQSLYDDGATYAAMSGSGSALFSLRRV